MPAQATKAPKKTKKKKTNLTRLYSNMNKLINDAVDNEIMKRFKLLIDASEEDMIKTDVDLLINESDKADPSVFQEGLQPYVKHYLFMVKRNNNKKLRAKDANKD